MAASFGLSATLCYRLYVTTALMRAPKAKTAAKPPKHSRNSLDGNLLPSQSLVPATAIDSPKRSSSIHSQVTIYAAAYRRGRQAISAECHRKAGSPASTIGPGPTARRARANGQTGFAGNSRGCSSAEIFRLTGLPDKEPETRSSGLLLIRYQLKIERWRRLPSVP